MAYTKLLVSYAWHCACPRIQSFGSRHSIRPPPVLSFFVPTWRVERFYWPHLEVEDPIFKAMTDRTAFIRWSPSWGLPGSPSTVRLMPGDLCPAPGIISLSPLSLADRRDWCYSQGKWYLSRNTDSNWLHRRTSIGFLAAVHGSTYAKKKKKGKKGGNNFCDH